MYLGTHRMQFWQNCWNFLLKSKFWLFNFGKKGENYEGLRKLLFPQNLRRTIGVQIWKTFRWWSFAEVRSFVAHVATSMRKRITFLRSLLENVCQAPSFFAQSLRVIEKYINLSRKLFPFKIFLKRRWMHFRNSCQNLYFRCQSFLLLKVQRDEQPPKKFNKIFSSNCLLDTGNANLTATRK